MKIESKVQEIKEDTDNFYISFIKYKNSIICFFVIIIFFIILNLSNYSINDQAYFYTLSTLSQTLAALIGIIGMFLIFRLQLLQSKKSDYIKELRNLIFKKWFIDKFPFFDLYSSDSKLMEDSIYILNNELENGSFTKEELEFRTIVFELQLNSHKFQIYKLYISFPFRIGAISILISIILLPLGQILIPEKSIFPIFSTTIAIGVVVAISIASILAIIDSLMDLLKSEFD